MKRLVFIAAVLLLVLASCTKSQMIETPELYPTEIGFQTYTGRLPESKAPSIEGEEDLKDYGFTVKAFLDPAGVDATADYADPYLDKDVTWSMKDNSEGWNYPGYAYWPEKSSGNSLDFVAYALNNDNITGYIDFTTTAESTTTSEIEFKYTVNSEVSKQRDLLVAVPQKGVTLTEEDNTEEDNTEGSNTYNNGTVTLEFKHVLSRIGFSLVTTKDNQVPVTIESVKLVGDFYATGTVDLTKAASISGDGTATEITYNLFGTGGHFTGYGKDVDTEGKLVGEPMYNNSSLYEKYTGDNDTSNDDVYNGVYATVSYNDNAYVVYSYESDNQTLYVFKVETTTDATTTTTYYSATLNGEKNGFTYGNEISNFSSETVLTPVFDIARKATADANAANRYMMIIPQAGLTADDPAVLKVTYFLPGAGTFDEIEVELMNGTTPIQFEAGKSYDFKLKVSTAFIGFSVEVEVWDTATGNAGDTITLC